MLLILLFLASLPAHAAEITFAGGVVEVRNITPTSAGICWYTSPAASLRVAFDTTANFGGDGTLDQLTVGDSTEAFSGSAGTKLCFGLSGLVPGTAYTACPSITNTSGANSTNCSSGGNVNSRVAFTTSAQPATWPEPPTAAAQPDTTYPASFVSTIDVASDCSNFESQVVAALGLSGNRKVRVPPGVVCAAPGSFSNTPKTGGGQVVIIPNPETCLPPDGARVTPTYSACTWIMEADYTTPCLGISNAGASGLRFVGMTCRPKASNYSTWIANPRVTENLVVSGVVDGVIFDRCIFDGRGSTTGVPRVHFGYQGPPNNFSFINSYMTNIDQWLGWVATNSTTASGSTISNPTPFYMGHGDGVVLVPAFSISTVGMTATTTLGVRSDGSVHFSYSGTAPASCTGATCDTAVAWPDEMPWNWSGCPSSCTAADFNITITAGTITATTFQSNTILHHVRLSTSAIAGDAEISSGGFNFETCGGSNFGTIMIRNSYLMVAGIAVFMNGDGCGAATQISDVSIMGNTIESNPSGFVLTSGPSASPMAMSRRHHIETKNSINLTILGNVLRGGWVGVNANLGQSIALKRDLHFTSDVDIRNNTISDDPSFLNIAGDLSNPDPGAARNATYTKLIQRVRAQNNVVSTNAITRCGFWLVCTATNAAGYFVLSDQQVESLIVDHNTAYPMFGTYASLLLQADKWRRPTNFTNNIGILNGATIAYRGIQSVYYAPWNQISNDAANLSFTAGSGNDGTTALNRAHRSVAGGYDVRGNLFIAGCTASTCADGATTLVGDLSAQYPAGNSWIVSGGTFSARASAIGFRSITNADYGLKVSSSYMAGAHLATDGGDLGANTDAIRTSQGTIYNLRALSITSSAATIYFTAPSASTACYVGKDQAAFSVATADTTASRIRSVALSGLASGTTYAYIVGCSGSAQVSGSFTTL